MSQDGSAVQFFRVLLSASESADDREIVVVSASPHDLEEAALSSFFPGRVLAVLREHRDGWARITCADATADDLAAAAVATVKAICGWDESPVIVIEVGPRHFEVAMKFRDNLWFAEPRLRGGSVTHLASLLAPNRAID